MNYKKTARRRDVKTLNRIIEHLHQAEKLTNQLSYTFNIDIGHGTQSLAKAINDLSGVAIGELGGLEAGDESSGSVQS